MKRPVNWRWLLGALALFAAGALGCSETAPAPEATGAAGALRFRVSAPKGPPRAGSNELRIQVEDQAGKPVNDADVSVRWSMAAMGAMPAMQGSAPAESAGDGLYRADVDLEMNGTWQVEIEARRPSGEAATLAGTLATGRAQIDLESSGASGENVPATPHEHDDEISHWTCPMHPSVREKGPGACPICGMDLVPVKVSELKTGEVRIDSQRRQEIGIRTGVVERGSLVVPVRAVGRVTVDERRLEDVSLKVRGWITKLYANALGDPVRAGEPLLELYSPELFTAQQEYLHARRSLEASRSADGSNRMDALVRAARTRLRLWDISDGDLAALDRRGEPSESLTIRSPVSGFVIEKNVVEGAAVEPGARLLRIAPLDPVWVEAEVYENQMELLRPGQSVTVSLPYLTDRRIEGRVSYIYPTLAGETRTARVRIELPNPDLALRPDMYANVEFEADLGERTLVPASAVLYAGPRRIVFVDLGDGRLRPREVRIGAGNGDVYEVLEGLEPGEQIVLSGNYLVASESRLKSALTQW
jgi:membrane fusion protein, copper/silver efflux system